MAEEQVKKSKPVTFSKGKILTMERYKNRVDLLGVLLNDKSYTLDEVDGILNKFMKGV
mgnify:CR=1 FL=1